ncbi:MAG: RNA polymerase sigma factor [Daejeonella sp.]
MNNCRSLSDQQLLDLIKSGDEAAFAEIYERYWGVMYAHVFKMLGEEDDAKDITQEIFTALWLKGIHIEYDTNISGYLYVMARNKVISLIRQDRVRKDYLGTLSLYALEMSNTTLEQLNARDLASAVERELQSLPCKMREIFELSRKQNLSHKEIAVRLEISDKTVKKQISNALKIIRLRLNTISVFLSLLF